MKHVPNALSLSRLGFAAVVLWLANDHRWSVALVALVVGASTDVLDGYIARRFDDRFGTKTDLGKNKLEPLGDLALSGSAILGLLLAGVWPWKAGIALAVLTIVFQAISWLAASPKFMHRLPTTQRVMRAMRRPKKVQRILHPLMYVVVFLAAIGYYIYLGTRDYPVVAVVCWTAVVLAVVVLAYTKRHLAFAVFKGEEPE